MATDGSAEDRVLVFSIALNGFGWAWRSCIRSHRQFADRWKFDYACVDLPWTVTPAEAAWLKVPLIIRALEGGCYAWVLFLDADARVRSEGPDFRRVATPGRHVYMAHGHSGRLNSGVIMVRRSEQGLQFFREILSDCEGPVPAEDAAPYENGHVIKHGKANPLVGVLERRWNNTADPNLDDYIRHFTGPMAAEAPVPRKTTKRWQRVGTFRNRVLAVWTPALPAGPLPARLDLMTEAVVSRYAVFRPRHGGTDERA
jgi:hypothetical protein